MGAESGRMSGPEKSGMRLECVKRIVGVLVQSRRGLRTWVDGWESEWMGERGEEKAPGSVSLGSFVLTPGSL